MNDKAAVEPQSLDPNVFAVLIPDSDPTKAAFRLQHNAIYYHPSVGGIADQPTIASRDTTPAASTEVEDKNLERLLLTFDSRPKDPQRGWQFGTDPNTSDVLLGYRGTQGISAHHFSITVNENLQAVLYDRSRWGTIVSYNDQAKNELRKSFRWCLSPKPGETMTWQTILFSASGSRKIKFSIEFPNHGAAHPDYLANLQDVFDESGSALPPVGALGLDSNPTTAAPSQPLTPSQRPVYLIDELIGEGGFGAVYTVRDASTWELHAGKTFRRTYRNQPKGLKRKLEKESWWKSIQNEVDIMKGNPHVRRAPLNIRNLANCSSPTSPR